MTESVWKPWITFTVLGLISGCLSGYCAGGVGVVVSPGIIFGLAMMSALLCFDEESAGQTAGWLLPGSCLAYWTSMFTTLMAPRFESEWVKATTVSEFQAGFAGALVFAVILIVVTDELPWLAILITVPLAGGLSAVLPAAINEAYPTESWAVSMFRMAMCWQCLVATTIGACMTFSNMWYSYDYANICQRQLERNSLADHP